MAYNRDDEERILIAWATDNRCHSSWRLRVTDFSTPACRFVFDVTKKFSEQYGMLPSVESISKEIELALRGDSQFTYTTKPDNAVIPAVADLLGRLTQPLPESEIIRVSSMLSSFLDSVRVGQVARLAQENGWTPGQTVEAMNQVHEDAKSVAGINVADEFSSGCEVDLAAMERPEMRVPSGIAWLDNNTNGGLVRGNVALLVAVSGLGKTVGMLNFAANANERGLYSLFMTLENPGAMIRRRWQAIMGYYPVKLYGTPLLKWPSEYKRRFEALTHKESLYRDKMTILDKAGKKLITIDGVEQAIVRWKRQHMANGVPEEQLALVCVDWLKYIDMTSVPGVSRNSRADEPVSLAIQALGNIARRHKVVIWTAQQANRGAQKKEVLGPEDIADSTAIQNYLDLGIAFARPSGDLQKQALSIDGTSTSTANTDTDRQLIISCFKSRESALAGRRGNVYQNPSLRIWDSKDQCLRIMGKIKNEDPVARYCPGATII